MRYLVDMHSAELELCSHKEELLRLRWEHLAPPHSLSQCYSGNSDSHSSLSEMLNPSPLKRSEQSSTNPKSWRMKSALQPPLRDRGNGYLTFHLSETDIWEICSLSSRRYSAQCSQTMMHNTFTCAHPSEGGTRKLKGLFSPCLSTRENCSTWCIHRSNASQIMRLMANWMNLVSSITLVTWWCPVYTI